MQNIHLWHGSQNWSGIPDVQPIKSKSYECGPGIYTTTSLDTAKTYAKGSGSIIAIEISSETKWISDVEVSLDSMRDWVRNEPGLRRKTRVLNEFDDYERIGVAKKITATLLVNFCVLHEALTSKNGPSLASWLTSQGIDASLQTAKTGEDWVVIFNPKIILRAQKESRATIPISDYTYPLVKVQLEKLKLSSGKCSPTNKRMR